MPAGIAIWVTEKANGGISSDHPPTKQLWNGREWRRRRHTDRLILPVCLAEYAVDGKQEVCLVDGFSATTVIRAKVRAFKGMFCRLFGGMFSGFNLWDAAPKASKRA
jgi:hypothetical protein